MVLTTMNITIHTKVKQMSKRLKRKYIENMLARASSNLYFLKHFLFNEKADDIARQRSILILLSYSLEIILKAGILYTCSSDLKKELDEKLKEFSHHDINIILDELRKRKFLSQLGISDYRKTKSFGFVNYEIKMKNGNKIRVENFVNIRYDFTNQNLRNLLTDKEMREYIDETLTTLKKLQVLNT